MASDKAHTPRSILDAFYQAERDYMSANPEDRDFSAMAALLAPDVRLHQTAALPYAGTYVGIEGFQDVARQMADYLNEVDVRNAEIFESEYKGSNRIMSLSMVHLKIRKTGEELDFPTTQAITVDLEKGLIMEIRPFYWDVKTFNEAIGYQP
ncbi:uncharacterized protein A1O9_09174 [Exophiala aquamarina CBS 119918]|uniref:SnoaL-like domain-containing protein n=1 Tax=Exophiala aquamarina CBS 119918 TaxID=1182545 RepID=A0A072P4U2_9EURO|nr:uncharacterized protein A1O9_09174 [Exophiala aquamarina CBS 119918]KEF54732.1 hypothetical protein A1O9_09174 [Exophiala aquamarina CBS 119918]